MVWGSSYIVITQMLPPGYPMTQAALRALPAGLLLLALTRQLPPGRWIAKLLLLGALNFSIFWGALFIAAQRLPGGVAATLGAIQPLIVLVLAQLLLSTPLTRNGLMGALAGMCGVALLLLGPDARLDLFGIAAAFGGALSMALGVVLTRKWQPPVSALTFAAWQLTAGGLLLVPVSLLAEPALPPLTLTNIVGFSWLALIGGALSYVFWFRGIERVGPAQVTSFGFLSPLTAVVLGWGLLDQTLTPIQLVGALVIPISIWIATRPETPSVKPAPTTA